MAPDHSSAPPVAEAASSADLYDELARRLESLFRPLRIRECTLQNRVAVSPMTRGKSRNGVLDASSVDYYRRRAEGGAGLIVSEGAAINRRGAFSAGVPDFFGEEALAAWARVIEAVHAAGGRMMPQLWHSGLNRLREHAHDPSLPSLSPSGVYPQREGEDAPGAALEAMTQAQIDATIEDYAAAAAAAQRIGFDGVEIHAAHGYLIDSFFWGRTNRRSDRYGGGLEARTRFAVEILQEVRRRVGAKFPVGMRISQWKSPDFYDARLVNDPRELEALLAPLADAGVDFIDCSTRRFWEPEFPLDDGRLNLAGWAKRLTGLPTMTVGSVGIGQPLQRDRPDMGDADPASVRMTFEELGERMAREEFDLVAVGRATIANPDWAAKVRAGRLDSLVPYSIEMRAGMA